MTKEDRSVSAASRAAMSGAKPRDSSVVPTTLIAVSALVPFLVATMRASSVPQWRDDVAMVRSVGLVLGAGAGGVSALAENVVLLLPLGPRHFRGALVSAAALAITCALLFTLIRALLDAGDAKSPKRNAIFALLASLLAGLSPTLQREATVAGGATVALALGLGALVVLLDRSAISARRFALLGVLFGAAAVESIPLGIVVGLASLVGVAATKRLPRAGVLLPFLAGAVVPAIILAVPIYLRPLSTHLWVDVGRTFAFGALARLDVASLRVRGIASWADDVGTIPVAVSVAGLLLGMLSPRTRPLVGPLLVIIAPDLLVPSRSAGVLVADALAPVRGLAIVGLSAAAALALTRGAVALEESRLPFARPITILVGTFVLALSAVASEESAVLADRKDTRGADAWTDEALEKLPAHALILASSDALVFRLWAARLVRGERPDVVVVPLPLLAQGTVAIRLLAEEPALGPLLRDISTQGMPTEFSLSSLADARPLFVELDRRWDRALASHVAPSHLWLRFAASPLGPSDRKTAFADDSAAVDRAVIASHDDDRVDEATLEVLAAHARDQVTVAAFVGDRDIAQKSLDELGIVRQGDMFAFFATRRLASAKGGVDLRTLLPNTGNLERSLARS